MVYSPESANAQAQGFTFALIGDLATTRSMSRGLANVHAEISQGAVAWRLSSMSAICHARCARARTRLLKLRLSQFNALPHPVIFTPGDNDWTDCHDKQGVKGGDPLAALDAAARDVLCGRREPRQAQDAASLARARSPEFAKFRENVRWDIGGVTFVTLHITGSNNNLGRTPEGDAEYAERNAANLAWLQQAFAHAKANNSRAVMIIQQANIFDGLPAARRTSRTSRAASPTFCALLEKETIAFQKPVVLVHGDSHFFRIDNPFWQRPPRGQTGTPALENFRRVETFGSPDHHWVHVTVEPNDPGVFTFRPRIVAANVIKR